MDPILGQIQLYPYGFVPRGWARCEGQMLQIMDNPELYSLLGVEYGGDGRITFALPDLRNAKPLNRMWYCISMEGMYPQRS